MKYDLIIWDWNGTLLDDVSASLRSVNDMLDRREMPRIDLVRYRECIGVPIRCFYEQVFNMEHLDPEQKATYLSQYQEYGILEKRLGKSARMAVAPVVKFYPADRKALEDLLAECRA